MKKLIAYVCISFFPLFPAHAVSVSVSGIPVIDGQRGLDFVVQMDQLYKQYETLQNQLNTARQLYGSVSGARGYGGLLRDPIMRNHLPQNIADVYDYTNQSANAGISGTVDQILLNESLTGTISSAEQSIVQRQQRHAATNKAMAMRAYDGAQNTIDQIGLMINEINATQDQKAINELSARIEGQQAILQTEIIKLDMIHQLQQTEKELIEQQKRQNSKRILDINNPNVPRLSWQELQNYWNTNY